MVDLTEISPADAIKLSDEEFAVWLSAQESDSPPPSVYPLCLNEGRCGFLEAYIWRGEVALFEAVSHIWHSLNEPKNLRCISIGIAAGTGGSGKVALAKFLRRALRESLDYDGTWDQPFGSIDEFHKAAMSYFDSDFAHYERTIQKYADILNGEPGRHYVHTAKLIIGPWTRSPENLNATRECR